MRLFRRYFIPAGVSVDWLKSILPEIRQADFWQTGQDLIGGNTGIVMYAIESRQARPDVAPGAGKPSAPLTSQAPQATRMR